MHPPILSVKYNPRAMRRTRLGTVGLTATGNELLSKGAAVGATVGVSAIAAGAGAGSLAGPIGTVVGAVVGAVVGILTQTSNTASHIGSWDGGIVTALNSLPASAAGIGRQIPWNENSHGLVQIIEALLAVGVYMAWDTSLKSNYAVCAHWAMTFGQAVQNLAGAIVAGQSSVSIPLAPGAGGHAPFTFTFKNPGVSLGPDKISATVVMGSTGLMAAMMTALGGQNPQNIASNATNASAQKVYALMLDYWFANLAPAAAQPATPVPPTVSTAVQAASTAANTAAATLAATSTPVVVPSPSPPATAVSSATDAANAAALSAVKTPSTVTTVSTTPAAATAPSLPSGYGYNYAGEVVPVPPGYTLASNGYIMDSGGYIFGSANDDQLSSPTASSIPATAETSSPVINVSVPSTAATATPVAGSDNTMLYIGMAALAGLIIWKESKKK